MSERVLKQYVVDAFSDRVFGGNPAAVCVLEDWMPEELMLAIARENSLPETAFVLRRDGGYGLRWFAPGGEIDLCGHATLATAYVLFRFYEPGAGTLAFSTRSGTLAVTRRGDLYELHFPAFDLRPVPVTEAMAAALGARPSEAFMGRDLLCVFDRAETVRALQPDLEAVKALEGLLVHATCRERRALTASPVPSPRRSPSPRTRCAAPATATSSPTGAGGWGKGRWSPARPPSGAAPSTAARRRTGSSWRARRPSSPRRRSMCRAGTKRRKAGLFPAARPRAGLNSTFRDASV